jgi:hypothetical protein
MALCTNTDIYEVKMQDSYAGLDVDQRAAILGNVIHLDYTYVLELHAPCHCHP